MPFLLFLTYTDCNSPREIHLQALRQAGMRDRHWEQLSQQLNMPLKPDKDFVLSKALDLHLMDHLNTIQKVKLNTAGMFVNLLGKPAGHHRHCIRLQLAAAITMGQESPTDEAVACFCYSRLLKVSKATQLVLL